jgi:copper(I)-binding protein
MRALLILLNIVLLGAIVGLWFFWHPEPEELPLPGTYAEKLGSDVPLAPPPSPAKAQTDSSTGMVIVNSLIPMLPPGVRTGAAYLILRNTGSHDATLVSASSPAAASVELHAHRNDAGVMRMRQVNKIDIPAGQELDFRRAGYHLMLINLKAPLRAGERLPIRLVFSDGGSRTVNTLVDAGQASKPIR